jgi:cation diffusion facilitator family transporter
MYHMKSNSKTDSGKNLSRFALIAIGAALLTMGLKTIAFLLTGSIGLLSDAIESIVNLVGSSFAFFMLRAAERPADKEHSYGHSKAEYLSSALEGFLIFVAAASIIYTAIQRLLNPGALQEMGFGLVLSTGASLVNLAVGQLLIRTGKKHNSISLEADGRHLMTDVWTSVAVVFGLIVVVITGWIALDPIVAILVALNILWTAIQLLKRSIEGFMDVAIPEEDLVKVMEVIDQYRAKGIEFHAIRTRQAARVRFLSVHMLLKGNMSLHDAHHEAEIFEADLKKVLTNLTITTHLEPIDDVISMEDANENL